VPSFRTLAKNVCGVVCVWNQIPVCLCVDCVGRFQWHPLRPITGPSTRLHLHAHLTSMPLCPRRQFGFGLESPPWSRAPLAVGASERARPSRPRPTPRTQPPRLHARGRRWRAGAPVAARPQRRTPRRRRACSGPERRKARSQAWEVARRDGRKLAKRPCAHSLVARRWRDS